MLADDSLVQYVVLRRDLWVELGWPLGGIVAQACHAATAALWLSREQPEAAAYCAPEKLDYMHKVRPGALHVTVLLHCICHSGLPCSQIRCGRPQAARGCCLLRTREIRSHTQGAA